MRKLTNILITGGCGFIGTNFIRFIFSPEFVIQNTIAKIINLDALTYAGNRDNLKEFEENPNYIFIHGNICNQSLVNNIFKKYDIDTVVHFAAESHVDRSISEPDAFIKTNVFGTFTLLEVARNFWKDRNDVLFHHISTDEVYGSLGETGCFTETTPYDPRSPYSASKASGDHFVMSYYHTYGLPVTISNCSNNYGPYQYTEKLIPLMITNMLEDKPLPVYGDGKNIRDWLFVKDHNTAVLGILKNGRTGQTYNIGGENEWENLKLVNELIKIVAEKTGKNIYELKKLITFVKDRLGHDRRYAIDCSKIKNELGWKQSVSFKEGLSRTVDWYLSCKSQ